MSGSLLIDGMMAFFTIVLIGAVVVPFRLFVPKWMESVRDRRAAFHVAAIDALAVELSRPQPDLQHAARLLEQRRRNIAALLSLDPQARIPALHDPAVIEWREAA